MPSLFPVLILVALGDPAADPPTPADLVAALESTLSDAIAKASPSVVAIAREKNAASEETLAVRNRRSNKPVAPTAVRPGGPEDFANGIQEWNSSDFGSGIVIG